MSFSNLIFTSLFFYHCIKLCLLDLDAKDQLEVRFPEVLKICILNRFGLDLRISIHYKMLDKGI